MVLRVLTFEILKALKISLFLEIGVHDSVRMLLHQETRFTVGASRVVSRNKVYVEKDTTRDARRANQA